MAQDFLKHTYVVILCGGGGTRVWPLSVNKRPKQFLNFHSEDTLYQEAVKNAKLLVNDPAKIIVITNKLYTDQIKKESPEIPAENIIAEPEKRDTALAMGVAAAFVHHKDSKGVTINLASDHVIGDKEVFKNCMLTAAKVAYEGKYLIAVGIKPTFAHPGLGYIQFGKHIKEVNGLPLRYVASFKEKPDIPTAEQYLAQGDYLWNANNYTWGASTLLEAFEVHDPGHAANIKAIQAAIGTPQLEAVMAEQYEHAEKTPIDTAISEKAENLLVLPGMYSWDDIGGWQVVYDLAEKDADGNSHIQNKDAKTPVPIIEQDSKNNLIYYSNQPIAVLGLSDVVVVDTGSGLLVANRHQANDVKKIVEKLKSDGNEQYV